MAESDKQFKFTIAADDKATTVVEGAIKSQRELAAAQRDAAKIIDSLRTPHEKYNAEIGKYHDLLKKGVLSHEDYTRAVERADKALHATEITRRNEALEEQRKRLEAVRIEEEKLASARQRQVADQAEHGQRLTELRRSHRGGGAAATSEDGGEILGQIFELLQSKDSGEAGALLTSMAGNYATDASKKLLSAAKSQGAKGAAAAGKALSEGKSIGAAVGKGVGAAGVGLAETVVEATGSITALGAAAGTAAGLLGAFHHAGKMAARDPSAGYYESYIDPKDAARHAGVVAQEKAEQDLRDKAKAFRDFDKNERERIEGEEYRRKLQEELHPGINLIPDDEAKRYTDEIALLQTPQFQKEKGSLDRIRQIQARRDNRGEELLRQKKVDDELQDSYHQEADQEARGRLQTKLGEQRSKEIFDQRDREEAQRRDLYENGEMGQGEAQRYIADTEAENEKANERARKGSRQSGPVNRLGNYFESRFLTRLPSEGHGGDTVESHTKKTSDELVKANTLLKNQVDTLQGILTELKAKQEPEVSDL